MKIFQLAILQILRSYKMLISPMLPAACRYVPTCSEYAMEAVERCGVFRGGLKAAWRILRCHPFVSGGYDPVVRTDSTQPGGCLAVHPYSQQGNSRA